MVNTSLVTGSTAASFISSLNIRLVQPVVELDPEAVRIAEEDLKHRVVVHELFLERNAEPLEPRLHVWPVRGVERDVAKAAGAPASRRDLLQADVQHRMAAGVEPPTGAAKVRAETILQAEHLAIETQRLFDLGRRDDDVEVIDQPYCHGEFVFFGR